MATMTKLSLLFAVFFFACGGEAATQSTIDASVKIVEFTADPQTVEAVTLVAVADGNAHYTVKVIGNFDDKILEGELTANLPTPIVVKGLEYDRGYTAIISIWKSEEKDGPFDDAEFVMFRTPKEEVVTVPEEALVITSYTVESFGSASARVRFDVTKPSFVSMERYVPGSSWTYFSSGMYSSVPNAEGEFFFPTTPGESYTLRLVAQINNATGMVIETAVSPDINYQAPQSELELAHPAYGSNVMYFNWFPADHAGTDAPTIDYINLKARCGDSSLTDGYYSGITSSDVFGFEVFVNFQEYFTINSNTRCQVFGEHKVTGHRVTSNTILMDKLVGEPMKLEVLAVNATDMQFRLSTGGRTLTSPTAYCNTPENDAYGIGMPWYVLWQQGYQQQGVGRVSPLLPDRRHYCTMTATDARTGNRVVVRPVFITTRPAYHISFSNSGVVVGYNGYAVVNFSWQTNEDAAALHFECVCDRMNLPGCRVAYDMPVSGQAGRFTLSGLVEDAYYTCTGYAQPHSNSNGTVLGGGEYSFLAVPMQY